jgi:hypothetical protein
MYIQFYPKIQWLLLPYSNERSPVYYANDNRPFTITSIGPRPPYYTNPRYTPNFPVI